MQSSKEGFTEIILIFMYVSESHPHLLWSCLQFVVGLDGAIHNVRGLRL